MSHEVEPVRGHEDQLLAEYKALGVNCAEGFSVMMDILAESEPGIRNRCGLIADRHELYAIPIPDCAKRVMVVSIDRRDQALPRRIHGTLPASKGACNQGAWIAIAQLKLINPSWETGHD